MFSRREGYLTVLDRGGPEPERLLHLEDEIQKMRAAWIDAATSSAEMAREMRHLQHSIDFSFTKLGLLLTRLAEIFQTPAD